MGVYLLFVYMFAKRQDNCENIYTLTDKWGGLLFSSFCYNVIDYTRKKRKFEYFSY